MVKKARKAKRARAAVRFRDGGSGRVARARAARASSRRFVGLGPSDRRLLGLAIKVIEEDRGLLRRLADR